MMQCDPACLLVNGPRRREGVLRGQEGRVERGRAKPSMSMPGTRLRHAVPIEPVPGLVWRQNLDG